MCFEKFEDIEGKKGKAIFFITIQFCRNSSATRTNKNIDEDLRLVTCCCILDEGKNAPGFITVYNILVFPQKRIRTINHFLNTEHKSLLYIC